jgi:ketosteroid isomerase-like protein
MPTIDPRLSGWLFMIVTNSRYSNRRFQRQYHNTNAFHKAPGTSRQFFPAGFVSCSSLNAINEESMLVQLVKIMILSLTIMFDAQAPVSSIDEKQLLAIEHAWLQAYANKDAAAFPTLVHPDFVMIYASGLSETKEEVLSRWQSVRHDNHTRIFTRDVTVHKMSEVEIALKGIKVLEVYAGNQNLSVSAQYKDVYRRDHGVWKVYRAYQLPNE